MWIGGQRHASAALPPGMTRYPAYRRLGGPEAGLDGHGKSRYSIVRALASCYTHYAILSYRIALSSVSQLHFINILMYLIDAGYLIPLPRPGPP